MGGAQLGHDLERFRERERLGPVGLKAIALVSDTLMWTARCGLPSWRGELRVLDLGNWSAIGMCRGVRSGYTRFRGCRPCGNWER